MFHPVLSSLKVSTLNCHSVSGHLSSSHHRDSYILSSKLCLWLLFLLRSLCVLYFFQQVFVIAQILSHNFIISGIGSMRFLGFEFLVLFPCVFCTHRRDDDVNVCIWFWSSSWLWWSPASNPLTLVSLPLIPLFLIPLYQMNALMIHPPSFFCIYILLVSK